MPDVVIGVDIGTEAGVSLFRFGTGKLIDVYPIKTKGTLFCKATDFAGHIEGVVAEAIKSVGGRAIVHIAYEDVMRWMSALAAQTYGVLLGAMLIGGGHAHDFFPYAVGSIKKHAGHGGLAKDGMVKAAVERWGADVVGKNDNLADSLFVGDLHIKTLKEIHGVT